MVKLIIRLIVFLASVKIILSQDYNQESFVGDSIRAITNQGNVLYGIVALENDSAISVETEFGMITINRINISSIVLNPGNSNVKKEFSVENSINTGNMLNQEARWRTILGAMALGNGLYGWAVPSVLEFDGDIITASQLLMFGGGFYSSYYYTKNKFREFYK